MRGDYRHPDKGGDQAKFKQLGEAYEILSNPEKKIYTIEGVWKPLKETPKEEAEEEDSMIFSPSSEEAEGAKKGPRESQDQIKRIGCYFGRSI